MKVNPTILVLAGGGSSNFGNGYPKYLLEVDGKPLIEHVLLAINKCRRSKIVSVILNEDDSRYYLENVIKQIISDVIVVKSPSITKGAACSALLAIESIYNDDPLVIINGDQFINTNLQRVFDFFIDDGLDGGIVTFESLHPRWSYVRLDERGLVIEAAEKRPISKYATAGCYYFRRGRDFVDSAFSMIEKGASVNGLYYVCPAYNEMILAQRKIGVFQIDRDQYFSLATPENVEFFAKFLERSKIR